MNLMDFNVVCPKRIHITLLLNMKNSMVMLNFTVFDWKYPFLEYVSKNHNILLKLRFKNLD